MFGKPPPSSTLRGWKVSVLRSLVYLFFVDGGYWNFFFNFVVFGLQNRGIREEFLKNASFHPQVDKSRFSKLSF